MGDEALVDNTVRIMGGSPPMRSQRQNQEFESLIMGNNIILLPNDSQFKLYYTINTIGQVYYNA